MELLKFNYETFLKDENKRIWLVNFSEYYLREFCSRGNILERISGGWDDVPYRQGNKNFLGRIIKVTDYEYVRGMEKDNILLILDSFPQGRFDLLGKRTEIMKYFNEVYYFSDEENEIDLGYRKKYADRLLENIIIFRSGAGSSRYVSGADFGDNARALFEYMLMKKYDEKYKLVWLVKNPQDYEQQYKDRNVIFLPYDGGSCDDEKVRELYYQYVCLAKYIFFTESAVFCRNARADQVRVQLWHGCGFKSLRKALVGRDEYKYEYMTVISKLYAKLHVADFGLREEQMLVTGYPKDDLLYHPFAGWKGMFGIPDAKKYIFWLPTWRTTSLADEVQGNIANKSTGMPLLETMDDMVSLNNILADENIVLVIKLHPWQERKMLSEWELSNIVLIENEDMAKADVQINELLGHADALISDYSSVAVDYTLLNRPIAFTLDDKKAYSLDRGFLWENIQSWMPGIEIYNYDDLVRFVKDVSSGSDRSANKRNRLDTLFHDFHDDQSSRRVLDALGII